MKRILPLLLVILFATSMISVPHTVTSGNDAFVKTEVQDYNFENMFTEANGPTDKEVRIALYHEENGTMPDYSSTGAWSTDPTPLETVLLDMGFATTRLDVHDIYNHELQTAHYDVFIMQDSLPRENITEAVKDFWEGGGGILGFDGVSNYLCHMGIMIPDSEGDHGYGTYWTYLWSDNQTIGARHPVTKEYTLGGEMTTADLDWASWDWPVIQGLSYADEFTNLTISEADSDYVNTLAREPADGGGRVINMVTDGNSISEEMMDLLYDAIQWLCPRPKARVAFDLSHYPYYGVDIGDPSGFNADIRFGYYRDLLVSKGYTFDKLYASPVANISLDYLESYDLFMINTPDINFTDDEVAAMETWVMNGGSLLAMGDNFPTANNHFNYLLSATGLYLSSISYTSNPITNVDILNHPVSEGAGNVYFTGGRYLNISGPAEPIRMEGPDILIAAQKFGEGRIMLIGDINALGSELDDAQNERFGENVANWLVADNADVLVFTNEPEGEDFWTGEIITPMETPVCKALHELGISYWATSIQDYFNESLYAQEWRLVIVDAPWGFLSAHLNDLEWFVDQGTGRLIMSWYQLHNFPSHSLYEKMGFYYAGDQIGAISATHIWYTGHPIFHYPVDYESLYFNGSRDYGTTGNTIHPTNGGTAVAGYTLYPEENVSSIVLNGDGMTLYNAYLIDQYSDDVDNSTYEDRLELWINEISFMMRPFIDHPPNFVQEAGSGLLTWHPNAIAPEAYTIWQNVGLIAEDEPWDGGPVSVDLSGLTPDVYTFQIDIWNAFGQVTDVVIVTVEDTTDPALVSSSGPATYPEGTESYFVNWTFDELLPESYILYINGSQEEDDAWNGALLEFDVGGFSLGMYNLTVQVNDTSGNSATDTIWLEVTLPPTPTTSTSVATTSTSSTGTSTPTTGPTTGPTTDTTTEEPTSSTTLPTGGDNTILIIAVVVGGVLVLIIIIIIMRKK